MAKGALTTNRGAAAVAVGAGAGVSVAGATVAATVATGGLVAVGGAFSLPPGFSCATATGVGVNVG